MKKILAGKAAAFVGNLLTDVLPLGNTVKTGVQSAIEARNWFKVIMWSAMGLGVLGGVIAFLTGNITMEELEKVIGILNEVSTQQ